MALEGLEGVGGAGGLEAAGMADPRREDQAIGADGQGDDVGERAHGRQPSRWMAAMAARISPQRALKSRAAVWPARPIST